MKWINVEIEKPKNGEDILTFDKSRENISTEIYYDEGIFYEWSEKLERYFQNENITHWMPLPEPPKEEKEEG